MQEAFELEHKQKTKPEKKKQQTSPRSKERGKITRTPAKKASPKEKGKPKEVEPSIDTVEYIESVLSHRVVKKKPEFKIQ